MRKIFPNKTDMSYVTYSTGKAATETIDLNDAADTTSFTFDAPKAGKILLNQSFAVVIEAIGTQATTAGVGSIEVGGTEIATITTTASDAVGTTYTLTPATVVGDDQAYPVAAGDAIEFITKTQAVDGGGTVTGELEVVLAMELADS